MLVLPCCRLMRLSPFAFVVSFVCHPLRSVQVENGFMLWSYQGVRIHEEPKPACYYVIWRPRLRGLLTDDEAAEVKKNLNLRIRE